MENKQTQIYMLKQLKKKKKMHIKQKLNILSVL